MVSSAALKKNLKFVKEDTTSKILDPFEFIFRLRTEQH